MSRLISLTLVAVLPGLLAACGAEEAAPLDPATAPRIVVDRFSATAGHLMVRDAANGLPAAGAPIDFDQGPFVTTGLSPSGQTTRYYNFDVQPTVPASIYVLVRGDEPVPGQLNIVDRVPGEAGYNDFWRVVMVDVPDDYVANSVTSLSGIEASGFTMTPTENLVNCPIVPEGSTARSRFAGAPADLHRGWYRDQIVTYFTFEEKALTGTTVPTSPIYVAFNINPGQDGGGPPSGFVTEPGTDRTHNVVATSPAMPGYSPLWAVQIYDNADFASVTDLASAQQAQLLAPDAALVNCPIIE
jgi:hypothetical protein